MRDFRDGKAMAHALKAALAEKNVTISVAESLEFVAQQFGFDNWNVLAAKIAAAELEPAQSGEQIHLNAGIPVIRMFDIEKAGQFYVDFLGFKEDWRGEVFPGAPLYMQVSRGPIKLHLSEHHGDAAPGGTWVIQVAGIRALHAELMGKNYKYNRPGLDVAPYGAKVMYTVDPFGNRLRFEQEIKKS